MIELDELGRLADQNLAGTFAAMGAAIDAPVSVSGGLTCVATGIPLAFFNGAYAAREVSDPEQQVRDATEFMASAGVPWLMWVREGVDDALLDAGRRAGLTDAGGPPGMGIAAIPASPPPPDGLEIDVVTTSDDVVVCRDLTARGFGMPPEVAERLVNELTVSPPNLVSLVGRADGVPVSMALVSVTGTTAGVYNVATPAEHRRKGYGAALTWAAIEAGVQLGADHAVLQASPMGQPVYEAMGFVHLGDYVQLEGPPAAE